MRYFILILTLILTSTSLISAQEHISYEELRDRIYRTEASGRVRLTFDYERLFVLPASIDYASSFEILELNHNQLSSLPPEIGNLNNLRIFTTSYNYLSELPSEIGNLTNLTQLNLSRLC
ncbi:MAG: hypothetical protein Phog2KO_25090 [Phototrophicaceae bacterium]